MGGIRKALDRLKYRGGKIIYVDEEYCSKGMECSVSKRDYYFYEYTRPNLIITSDHRRIEAEEILKKCGNSDRSVRGLRGEVAIMTSWNGERRIEYTLLISKEACPLQIQYIFGRGEGYSDSEYWSSEYQEYWESYL